MLALIVVVQAQSDAPSLDVFAQYGVVGALAALGLWFMWKAYQREVKTNDALRAELAELRKGVDDKVLPLVSDMTALLRAKESDREQLILLTLERISEQLTKQLSKGAA